MSHRLLVLPLLLVSTLAHAQGTSRRSESISLRDTVARAVQHSPALLQSGAETAAEVEVTIALRDEATFLAEPSCCQRDARCESIRSRRQEDR